MTERKTAPARAAKIAPARKATRATKVAPPAAPDQDYTEEATDAPEGEIVFRGRPIRVRMPSPEQILIWKRTMERLENANLSDWNGQQVLAALDRSRKIVDSVIVDTSDIDWIDDEMLAGKFGLKEASQIILDALGVFQNRQQRRATKTAARRKKV